MNTSDEQVRATIAQQAGEWFAMHRAAALDAAERRAFADWILASPVHVEEYLGVALVARDLPAAADDPEMSFESLLDSARDASAANVVELGAPPSRATVTRVRPRIPNGVRFAAAAAVVAMIGSALLWWNAERVTPQHYATRHGEQRSWQLADDSVLRLDTDTAVTVRYGRSERRVEVENGQASSCGSGAALVASEVSGHCSKSRTSHGARSGCSPGPRKWSRSGRNSASTARATRPS